MFNTIVVAIDGSAPARRALETACVLAGHMSSQVHLVHSPELDTTAQAMGAGAFAVSPRPDEVEKAGKKIMDEAVTYAANQGCIIADHQISPDHPADAVVRYAIINGADLIVAGRRGMGSLSSLVLGSTSQQIAHDAPCALLTVK